MAEEVKLFRTWASSFAQGIVWALKIKGIEEYVIMVQDLSSNIPSPFLYNPIHKKILMLVNNGENERLVKEK